VVAVGILAMMGCGSRTSMLELEGYELGGSSFGGSFTTGGQAMGTAGTLLVPAAGAPSTPTTDPCAQYCSGYAKTCANELKGRDCRAVCQAEIDGSGSCQVLGISAIQCLTPFFQPGNGSCEAATSRGLAQCGNALANFKTCTTGAPMLTPPPPPDLTDPTTCPSMGVTSPGSCDIVFACSRSTYHVSCSLNPDIGGAHCYCSYDDLLWMDNVRTTDSALACVLAVSQCSADGAREQ
jgi:hypothetical protein